MNFGMSILNQSIRTMQSYAAWIQITLSFILKLKIFIDIAYDIIKDLIRQILKLIDHCLKEKIKK